MVSIGLEAQRLIVHQFEAIYVLLCGLASEIVSERTLVLHRYTPLWVPKYKGVVRPKLALIWVNCSRSKLSIVAVSP